MSSCCSTGVDGGREDAELAEARRQEPSWGRSAGNGGGLRKGAAVSYQLVTLMTLPLRLINCPTICDLIWGRVRVCVWVSVWNMTTTMTETGTAIQPDVSEGSLGLEAGETRHHDEGFVVLNRWRKVWHGCEAQSHSNCPDHLGSVRMREVYGTGNRVRHQMRASD